jgi:hypothetical protein
MDFGSRNRVDRCSVAATLANFCFCHKDVLIAVMLSIVTLVPGAVFMTPGVVGVYHDDGIYVSTAIVGSGTRISADKSA